MESVRCRIQQRWRSQQMRALLLGVAVAGGCAVYEVPRTSGVSAGVAGRDNGFGGSNGGDGSGAEQAEPNSGGQLLSVAAGAGNAGASDGDGGFPSEPVSSGGAPTGSVGEAGHAGDGASVGEAGQGGEGGLAGASGWGGEPAGAGGSTPCAARWRTQSSCEDCATQVQPDLRECAVVLDCYVDKNCGPSSCANPDQKCGTNILRIGAAAYRIAKTVYDCLCQ